MDTNDNGALGTLEGTDYLELETNMPHYHAQ